MTGDHRLLDTGVPALVVRMDDDVLRHGTLGAVRSLGRVGVEVHAVLEGGHFDPVARSRYLARWHSVGLGRGASAEAWVAALLAVGSRIGRRAVLIPMDDAGAMLTAERREELSEAFLLPDQVPELPRRLSDKAVLAQMCREAGVPHPAYRVAETGSEAVEAVEVLGLPVVAKWTRSWLLPSDTGFRSTSLLRTMPEVRRLAALVDRTGIPLLVQRYLPGDGGSDWFFHGYFDTRSRCLLGATGRKERSYPPGAGTTTLGRWLANDDIAQGAAEFAASIGFVGALDLDLRRDPDTGEFHLLDARARLGTQFRLFTFGDGLDVVRALHLDLTGRVVPAAQPRHGRVFFVEDRDPVTARFLRPLQPSADREPAWYAVDDPRPAAATASAWVRHLVRKTRTVRPRRSDGDP